MWKTISPREPGEDSNLNLPVCQEPDTAYPSVNFVEIIFVLLASTIMTLLFDLPMQEVKNLLMETNPAIKQEAIPHPPGASTVHGILPTPVDWASLAIDPVQSLDVDGATALRLSLALKSKYADLAIGREKLRTAHLFNLASRGMIIHRIKLLYIALTRGWPIAIDTAGDTSGDPDIHRPGLVPPARIQQPTVIYRDRPTSAPFAPPRGRS
uniref:Uncharacterized protein n=1 Tax=Timema bartmani TaxID=61472 RepID=A0A7R9EU11_9NEOP|nr:unnamed protein product [Timema bartmani]